MAVKPLNSVGGYTVGTDIITDVIDSAGTLLRTSAYTLYVATNGNDANEGGINSPFLTIEAGLAAAYTLSSSGVHSVSVHVAPGTYVENMPLTITPNVALMGDNVRSVHVQPSNPADDMFYLTNGCYIWGITVQQYTSTAFSYNPDGSTCATYGSVYVSPYIQNVTSYTTIPVLHMSSATSTTGQFSASSIQTGPWPEVGDKVLITGQLSGTATITDYFPETIYYVIATTPGENFTLSETLGGPAITTTSGTTVGLTFNYYVFGGLCVKIDGDQVNAYSTKAMILGFITILNQNGTGLYLLNAGYSQAVNIYTLYCNVGVLVESGSFITLNACDCGVGNYGLIADGVGALQTSGSTVGTSTAGTFVVNSLTDGQPFVNTVMQVAGDPTYYTIDTIIPVNALTYTVVIQQIYNETIPPGTTVSFYTRSSIIASAHTFEYVGAGVTYAGLPQYGGIPIEANEVIMTNGGVVTFTSTDQKGNFKVGQGFVINQATGTITGNDFYQSLFAQMTPFILALGSN